MFLLDTNVVSELRKAGSGRADGNVVGWSSGQRARDLFLSAVTVLELETGVLLVERRDEAQGRVLRRWMREQVLPGFSGRVLSADTAVALRCASLHVPGRRSERDALIAATALEHGMTLVTRNLPDFQGFAVPLLDPWCADPA